MTTFLYAGGFPVPPPTLTGSVTSDLVLIPEVIGVGEVAIAEVRSSQPTLDELARIVSAAYVGGTIAGKAGVTHFHTGPTPQRLARLHALLDRREQCEISPRHLYPTHVTRTPELLDHAVALAKRGRMGRLLGAVAQNPRNFGLRIDENTAIVVEQRGGKKKVRVLGDGAVYVVDGSRINYLSLSDRQADGVLTICNVVFNVLGANDEYDLTARAPAAAQPPPAAASKPG